MIYVLQDPITGTEIRSEFHKYYRSDAYEVFFNTLTGLEVFRGINGKPDPFKTDLPLLLDVGIMGSCPNKCPFCYQGDEVEPNMTLKNFKTIIDQVKDHTNQIAIGGRGDPNKHEQFEEILTYARKNGVIPSYTTSGVDLTEREVEISKLCGAVAVSDYETPQTYRAIQQFIDAGIKTNIHLIFTSATYGKCIKILYGYNPWWHKYNHISKFDTERLNGVVILLFKPQGRGSNCFGFIPSEYQIKNVSTLVFNHRNRFQIGIDSCLANHIYRRGDISEENKMFVDSCEASRMSAYISPSMKMMPCSYADKELGVKITSKIDIPHIWERSHPFKTFNDSLKKNKYCCPAGF